MPRFLISGQCSVDQNFIGDFTEILEEQDWEVCKMYTILLPMLFVLFREHTEVYN